MNILHIADLSTVTPTYTTGIAEVVLTLTCCQRNMGHNASIGLIKHNKYLEEKPEITFLDASKFSEIIRNNKVDIVIFHSLYKLTYLKFSKILRKMKIPYCIEFHGGATIQNASKGKIKKYIANAIGFNNFVKKASSLIYLSNKEKELSVFKIVPDNSIIIPNGIRPRENVISRKNRNMNRKIEFIFLARIDIHHKGLDVLCDALDLLISEGYDSCIHFSFYGTEKFGHYFTDRIKTLTMIADYKGPVIGEEKFKAFENSDIYILTSRYEGMPVTVLEALSCGCPCLITPQTNMTDLIIKNNCGWITSINPSEIASTIKSAVSDYKVNFEKYWDNSIIASHTYEWNSIISKSIEDYQNIIDRYGRC